MYVYNVMVLIIFVNLSSSCAKKKNLFIWDHLEYLLLAFQSLPMSAGPLQLVLCRIEFEYRNLLSLVRALMSVFTIELSSWLNFFPRSYFSTKFFFYLKELILQN